MVDFHRFRVTIATIYVSQLLASYLCFFADQKAATKRKIQPVVWDKGSQSGSSGSSLTATAGTASRGGKIKRGDAPRRGKY